MSDEAITDLGDDRVSIPLEMLQGNLECLLENKIEVQSISLEWHGVAGVILIINQTAEQREANAAKGFRTKTVK